MVNGIPAPNHLSDLTANTPTLMKEEWLRVSIQRILSTLESAPAIEVFSSLYATIHPWESLTHQEIFETLDPLCGEVQQRQRFRGTFSLTC